MSTVLEAPTVALSMKMNPEPAVYEGVPAEEYHQWLHASNSRLSIIHDKSPAHALEALLNPDPSTDAQVIGTATHVAILEPDAFAGLYVRMPKFDRRTTVGKVAAAEFEMKNADRIALSEDNFDLCLALRDSVNRHTVARSLIREAAGRELSIVWDDERTGVRCKGRLDGLARSINAIIDLKTTSDASPREYPRSVAKWGYHRQAAFYLDGAAALGVDCTDFAQIVVEKCAPYGVAVYRIDEAAIDAGRRQIRRLLEIYADCIRTGVWPAYGDSIQSITLPSWAFAQIDAEVL